MNTLALVLYAVFAIVAFGWRTWVQWRRTGDTGLRLAAAPGTVQWWAKLGFVAALAAGIAAPIAGLAGLDPLVWLDRDALRVAGIVIAVVGVLATAGAQVQMGPSWRIGVDPSERTGLVTSGIFAVVRNPIFTAMLIAAVGFTLMVGNVVALLGLGALMGALNVQVRAVEEPYLRSTHGQAFESYATQTGRFIPTFGQFIRR
ncbi:MAG: isoprenylcysteine carboxylmethyltransferase family protein [Microthrixaceae bacterium]|nr:isoprenylcysteine carboxylmethyltransferase family protein [Microthrixaceae bacterium]